MAETKVEQTTNLKELQERISKLEDELKSKDETLKKSEKIFTVRQAEFSNAVQPDPKFN